MLTCDDWRQVPLDVTTYVASIDLLQGDQGLARSIGAGFSAKEGGSGVTRWQGHLGGDYMQESAISGEGPRTLGKAGNQLLLSGKKKQQRDRQELTDKEDDGK